MMWGIILLAAGTMATLALVMGWALGWANRAFHVHIDPKIEAAEGILPGANCGGCGYVGCREYAEAVVGGEDASKCTVGGANVAQALGRLMGVEVAATCPYRPVVHCGATCADRLGRNEYRGYPSCAAANVISGVQECTYGCLGFGDCVEACKYDAIHIRQGLAVVDYARCVGCGACARACPRNIISMVPFKADTMMVVTCSNKDKGKDVSAACKVGCIGCGVCARLNDLFQVVEALAEIDYGAYDPDNADFTAVLNKCPSASLAWVGRPGAEDRAGAADDGAPEHALADTQRAADEKEREARVA